MDTRRKLEEFNRLTGRTSRIGDITSGLWDGRNDIRTGNGAYRAIDDAIADLL